jgi:hypothetical protein
MYASFVLNSIKDGNQVDSIYMDFSKAFDRVRHQLLLNEMAGILFFREIPENKNR